MMFDESIIQGAVQIANARIHDKYVNLVEPITCYMATELFQAAYDLIKKLEEERVA